MSDIEISNLSFGYDENLIFKNVNLDYKMGDFLAIFGPNGGGKSTLLKLILGLIKPSMGEVKIFGKEPKINRAKLGFVPQNIAFGRNFPISVLDVVLMGVVEHKIFGFYSKAEKTKAKKMLEIVGLEGFENRRIDELSGGQRQRVYIARALVSNAKILLLDEPTASIDTMGQMQIYTLLKELNKTHGIILISHDVNLALNYATKAIYVANGEVFMHEILPAKRDKFLKHIQSSNHHFCDIELALNECSCGQSESLNHSKILNAKSSENFCQNGQNLKFHSQKRGENG